MSKKELTQAGVLSARPGESWDRLVPGFGVRVTANRSRGFFIMYRIGGKQHRWTFADPRLLDLVEARERARGYLQLARDGIDPRAKPKVLTVRAAFKEYMDLHVTKKLGARSIVETPRMYEQLVLPRIGDRPLGEVTRQELMSIVNTFTARGKLTSANRTFAALRGFFGWCLGQGYIDLHPLNGSKLPNPENERERHLSKEEVAQFWQLTADLGDIGRVLRLLLATGQRVNEVRLMNWSEINGRTWVIPAARAKNKSAHEVHLSDAVLGILGEPGEGLVFHISYNALDRAKDKLMRTMGLTKEEEFTFHDLRRTFATRLAADHQIEPQIIDALLNHKSGVVSGVTKRYIRTRYLQQRQEALDLWGRVLEPISNVVEMTSRLA